MPTSESTRDAALREVIRAVGLRVTAPRLAVLRLLADRAQPVSHADVVDALAVEGWDRATLFRNLTDLAEAGLLLRVDLGDHTWRYELKASHAEGAHPHFLCVSCGDIACLPADALPTTTVSVPRAMREGRAEVQVRGVCDRCDDQLVTAS